MLKIISALLILAGFAFAGKAAADEQRSKCVSEKKILSMLTAVENRLRSARMPLGELILSLASENGRPRFITECANKTAKGMPFPQAWEKSICEDENLKMLSIKDALLNLGAQLGTADIETQLSAVAYCKSVVTEALASEEEKSKKYSGIFPALGVLAGIWAAIILV